ncbi:MAG: DUF3597 domain-containing protein [Gemmatimonadaceae bacterium]
MSIFGSIMGKIMGNSARKQAAAENKAMSSAPSAPASASAPAVTASSPVDVAARLDEMKAASSQKLNWRESIVDLMKLVGIDSDLANRRALAQELGYTGDTNDSAKMNVWLHKQVMAKLAENGGTVPANLLD